MGFKICDLIGKEVCVCVFNWKIPVAFLKIICDNDLLSSFRTAGWGRRISYSIDNTFSAEHYFINRPRARCSVEDRNKTHGIWSQEAHSLVGEIHIKTLTTQSSNSVVKVTGNKSREEV